jgi:hypothetical protein
LVSSYDGYGNERVGELWDAAITNSEEEIYWRYADYLQIAQLLYQQTWTDELEGRNLFQISFQAKCHRVEGLDFASATLRTFKVVPATSNKEEMRIERTITIIPSDNLIVSLEQEFQPTGYETAAVVWSRYHITADEALQIADRSGGSAVRTSVNNQCVIVVYAPGESNGQDWTVRYVDTFNNLNTLFKIRIDSQDGSNEILIPKQE